MSSNDLRTFLRNLWQQGVELWLDGDQLRFRGDKAVMSGDTLSRLRANKEALIAIIRENPLDYTGFPLSHGQRSIHLMQRLAPESFAYNQACLLRLADPLNIQVLENSIDFLLQRHAPLRMSILEVGGHLAQQVSYSLPSILSAAEVDTNNEAAWREWVAREADRPFRLSEEPLIRAKLVTGPEQGSPRHLLIVAHHIIADFWAMELIVKELETIYLAGIAERTPELPETGRLYKDYVLHEQAFLASESGRAARDYWKKKLTPLPQPLELPADFTRPQRQSFRGSEYSFRLDSNLAARIRHEARNAQVTPFVWVLSAFQLLLHRYSGESRIAIGSPVACRTQSDFQRLAGHFTNPVVLLADFEKHLTFHSLLQENREQTLAALKYQEYPLQCLMEDLALAHDGNIPSLFQVAISWNQLNKDQQHNGGLVERIVMMGQRGAIYDLVLSCFDRGDDGIEFSLRYSSDLFREESIHQLARHLCILLGKAGFAEGDELARLDFRTPEEIAIAHACNDTASGYPANQNIAAIFRSTAAQFPDQEAFRHLGTTVSYRELETTACQMAAFLARQGIRPGQHIALCLERSLELTAAILAILQNGCIFVPINPDYPPERITQTVTNTAAPLLLSQRRHAAKLEALSESLCNSRILFLDDAAEEIRQNPPHFPIHRDGKVAAIDVACVVFTSGSTGKPKGVQVPHQAIARLVINTNYLTIHPGDRVLHLSNVSFDAINIELWHALLNGGCVVCVDNETVLNPEKFSALVRQEKPQAAFVTTALFNILVNHQADIFQTLNYLMFGGEAHDIHAILRCVRSGKPAHLLHVYGPTENGSLSTFHEIDCDIDETSLIPIGKPLANSQAYLHDIDGQLAPFGVIGEIFVGGDGISTGYLNQPELTAKLFLPDSHRGSGLLYATGDLAYQREDGSIVYAGRRDNQVKIRGYRIEPGEIEQNITHHPDITQAYVMVTERNGEPALAAYYTARCKLEPVQIRQFLRGRLPEFMVPAALMQLDSLPINPNGKIDKNRLPTITLESTTAHVAPRNTTEKKIAAIWQQMLGVESVGIHDNFFELGGHSLLAVRTASAMQEALGKSVTMRMLFDHPRIADLAEALAASNISQLPPIAPVANKQQVPASLAQQRLWFLQQLNPHSRAYNMPVAVRFTSPVRVALVEKCIRTLMERHEALRTTFADRNGVASLLIHPPGDWSLPTIDLSRLKRSQAEAEAKNQVNLLANSAFDTAEGPLLKAVMIRITHNEQILSLCLHHLILDGWSVELLLSEFGALWKHFQHHEKSQEGSPLPPLAIHYSDFSLWQRQWLQGELLEGQLDYWKRQLAGAPTLLDLPTDRPRPPLLGTDGALHHFTIPGDTVRSLRTLAQQHDNTLFMTLLAGFSILLARYSQQSDICIGFPISGRNHQALESLIGLFVNNLVIRCNLSGNPTIADYLQQVRQTTLDAYAHQDVPFDLIIDALKIRRSLSHTPFLQASFSLERGTLKQRIGEVMGGEIVHEPVEWQIAKYDLNLTCHEAGFDMPATLEYNTALYDRETMARMASHFVRLLEEMAGKEVRHVHEIKILSSDERRQFVTDWQQRDASHRPILNVVNRFEIEVEAHPERIALSLDTTLDNTRVTYRELNEWANQLARHLQMLGIGAGDFVGLFLDRSVEMVVAIIATLKTGAAYIPLDPKSPPERINFIIEDANIQHVATHSALAHPLTVKHRINLDEAVGEISTLPKNNLAIHIPGDTHAYVIYTSGTTGKPKGCLVTHRNLARLFTVTERIYHFGKEDVWTLFHSYAFDFSVWEIWGAMLYGGRLVIIPHWLSRTPDAFYQLLHDEQVTILNQTPSAFSQLIAIDQQRQLPLSLRHIIFGGEALDFAALQKWAEHHPLESCAITNMYGITETTVHVTWHRITANDLSRGRSIIGKPLDDLHIHLLDANGQHVPIGVLGEIFVSGAGVTHGYLNRPELTAERFVKNPFLDEFPVGNGHDRMYRSGDLARRLSNGDIEYLGRIDHQVKIRGHRIELGEIEAVLSALEGIHESIVIAREDEPGNRRLVAYLLSSEGASPDITAIRRHLKEALPEYMVPAVLIPMNEWPLTANGKIDRLQLPPPGPSAQIGTPYEAPRNETELAICAIWQEILGIERVGIHDNFFELGGHSLLATQVASRIRTRLDCQLELKAIFENPTVAELAVVILEEEIGALAIDENDLKALLADLDGQG